MGGLKRDPILSAKEITHGPRARPMAAPAQHARQRVLPIIRGVQQPVTAAAMPYKITWERAGVYRHYFGDVSVVERRASLELISGDRRFDDLRYALTNYLEVQAYESTPASTAEIAALHIGPLFTNPRILIVAVAQRDDILAAIADFQRHGFIKAPYRVFATLPEARAWIDGELR